MTMLITNLPTTQCQLDKLCIWLALLAWHIFHLLSLSFLVLVLPAITWGNAEKNFFFLRKNNGPCRLDHDDLSETIAFIEGLTYCASTHEQRQTWIQASPGQSKVVSFSCIGIRTDTTAPTSKWMLFSVVVLWETPTEGRVGPAIDFVLEVVQALLLLLATAILLEAGDGIKAGNRTDMKIGVGTL